MELLNIKILSLVKKIHNYPDGIYILTAILSVDLGLIVSFEKNVLTFDWGQLNFGMVITFFMVYISGGLIANIVLAFLKYFIFKLSSSMIMKGTNIFNSKENLTNYKKILELQDEALLEENDFKLKIINEHRTRYEKNIFPTKSF